MTVNRETAVVHIYGLRRICGTEFRYIGQTANLRGRLQQHLRVEECSVGHPKRIWIEEELANGGGVEIVSLEECSWATATDREKYWIDHYSMLGHRLTNVAKPVGTGLGRSVDGIPKERTTVFLSDEQVKRLEALKERTGSPVADHIRRAIDFYLEFGDWLHDIETKIDRIIRNVV